MNVFRLLGDLSHLLAIVILLMKIWKTRSCSGISGKTQALFAAVFVTRYLDLFVHFVSLYNTGSGRLLSYGTWIAFTELYCFRSWEETINRYYPQLLLKKSILKWKVMKIIYISLSIGTCYLIFVKFKATYDGNHDSMRAEFLVVPALGLACLINNSFDVMEILWTFSIYLEAVAILPQLFMISKVQCWHRLRLMRILHTLSLVSSLSNLSWSCLSES